MWWREQGCDFLTETDCSNLFLPPSFPYSHSVRSRFTLTLYAQMHLLLLVLLPPLFTSNLSVLQGSPPAHTPHCGLSSTVTSPSHVSSFSLALSFFMARVFPSSASTSGGEDILVSWLRGHKRVFHSGNGWTHRCSRPWPGELLCPLPGSGVSVWRNRAVKTDLCSKREKNK